MFIVYYWYVHMQLPFLYLLFCDNRGIIGIALRFGFMSMRHGLGKLLKSIFLLACGKEKANEEGMMVRRAQGSTAALRRCLCARI